MNMDNIYTYSQYQRWFSEYEHGQYIYLLSVSEVVL